MHAFGLEQSEADRSIFHCHNSPAKFDYLMVYVDGIVITRNYTIRISQLKKYLVF